MESNFLKIGSFFTFVGLIVLVLIFSVFSNKYERYAMYFVSSRTKQDVCEPRYVLKNKLKPREVSFVEELLLGPMNHDFYDYVNKKTLYNACFLRDGVLYVDFPKTVFQEVEENISFLRFYELFKKNVLANCRNVTEVRMSLDGVAVYEDIEVE